MFTTAEITPIQFYKQVTRFNMSMIGLTKNDEDKINKMIDSLQYGKFKSATKYYKELTKVEMINSEIENLKSKFQELKNKTDGKDNVNNIDNEMPRNISSYWEAVNFAEEHGLETSIKWPRGSSDRWQQELVDLRATVEQAEQRRQRRRERRQLREQVQGLQERLGQNVDPAERATTDIWRMRLNRLERELEEQRASIGEEFFADFEGLIEREEQLAVLEQAEREHQFELAQERTREHREIERANLLTFNRSVNPTGTVDYVHSFALPISSTDIELVVDFTNHILNQVGISQNDAFTIKLMGPSVGIRRGEAEQKMNSFLELVKDKNTSYNQLRRAIENFTQDGEYTFSIGQVIVRIIPALRGGCNNDKHRKLLKLSNFKLESNPVKFNNCLFSCIKEMISPPGNPTGKLRKVTKNVCNQYRNVFNLEPNSTINVEDAMKIFEFYRIAAKYQLRIICNDTAQYYTTKDFNKKLINGESIETYNSKRLTVMLIDGHYWKVINEKRACPRCFKKYVINHKCVHDLHTKCQKCGHHHPGKKQCNINHVTFYQDKILKAKNRYINKKFSKRKPLENNRVIHYDFETHTKNKKKQHEPFVVGYSLPTEEYDMPDFLAKEFDIPTSEHYDYYTGNNCAEKFLEKILEFATKRSTETYYVNAFNGSKFDHYFMTKLILQKGYKIKEGDFCLNNGSIFKLQIKNLVFIDLSKHTKGSLKSNLTANKCRIAKGKIDYDNFDEWSNMNHDIEVEYEEEVAVDNLSKTKTVNLQKECLAYLKTDVLGLRELYNKLNKSLYDQFGYNLHDFFSTSHTTFDLWRIYLYAKKYNNFDGKEMTNEHYIKDRDTQGIKLPSSEEEQFYRPAIFGGRCYLSKKSFESMERDNYLSGKLDYDKINDYLIDLDVVSLYPSVMQMFEYPCGKVSSITTADEISSFNEHLLSNKKCKNMGIYYIKYITNKYLAHAILPHRTDTGLKWTLEDGEGFYTSVDIENAVEHGYGVTLCTPPKDKVDKELRGIAGYYWTNQGKVFKSYIDLMFEKKKKASRGTPERALAKLFLNGLYGKMIQRPIADKTIWATSTLDFWKFFKLHKVTDIELIGNQMYLTGTLRDAVRREKIISKPTQLGAFILSYTRKLMLHYMNKSNPHFDISNDILVDGKVSETKKATYAKLQLDNDFYYTDTDSIQIHSKNSVEQSSELGGITDDLEDYYPKGGSAKILRGIWIAPKLYMLEFITSDSHNKKTKMDEDLEDEKRVDIRIVNGKKFYYLYRGKGVPTDKLNVEAFDLMRNGEELKTERDFSMKKINVKLNNPQKEKELEYFSIIHHTGKETERILNRKPWDGRIFNKDGSSRPIGSNSIR